MSALVVHHWSHDGRKLVVPNRLSLPPLQKGCGIALQKGYAVLHYKRDMRIAMQKGKAVLRFLRSAAAAL
jgi:hypothetical protein